MTIETKELEFVRLMNELRTEWFIMESALPKLNNVNQINALCARILQLSLTQQMIDEKT